LVFVDEMGSNTSLFSLYAWAPRGERARCYVPRNRGENMTLLASMTTECMGPCVAVVGATARVVFENYGERHLAPVLSPGQVIMMDDLGAHKGERVRELIVVPSPTMYRPPMFGANTRANALAVRKSDRERR
jgi:hypothetical protein